MPVIKCIVWGCPFRLSDRKYVKKTSLGGSGGLINIMNCISKALCAALPSTGLRPKGGLDLFRTLSGESVLASAFALIYVGQDTDEK